MVCTLVACCCGTKMGSSGNCQFHALAYDTIYTHVQLRKMAVECLEVMTLQLSRCGP